ncbi:MAG TPA: ABC transporter ATP-binding protein [Chloroflexota bacterium]
MSADPIVETWGLTKRFRGGPVADDRFWVEAIVQEVRRLVRPPEVRTVVDGVSLSVRRGEFFGVIGSNGAGKTTFLKMLACLLYPDDGGGRIDGHDLRRDRAGVRRSVAIAGAGGWLGMLWQLDGRENLLFRARMLGLPRAEAERQADRVLERLGIAEKAHEHSMNWSAGERQKFNLAMAFIGRSPLVMLDEPTSHLDPGVSREVREFVREELNRQGGQTVVMSTHYLEEAELLCDRVALFHRGKLLACDSPAALKRAHAPERIVELRALGYAPSVGERVKTRCGLTEVLAQFEDVATGAARLRPKWPNGAADPEAFRQALESEGVRVTALATVPPTLDDVYFSLARNVA